nr:hypothetical protein [Tanacetum cinerariifolium]
TSSTPRAAAPRTSQVRQGWATGAEGDDILKSRNLYRVALNGKAVS